MTTLYIKIHNATGLKYFGKTTLTDPYKYKGSGTRWTNHNKKHGYNVTTKVYAQFDEQDYIERILLEGCALLFSSENNIVNSKDWANIIPENGLHGSVKGRKCSKETREKISKVRTGKKHSEEAKKKISESKTGRKGFTHSAESKAKMSRKRQARKRKPLTEEHKKKISESSVGMKFSDEHKRKLSEAKLGNMWIFNLELKISKPIKQDEFPEYESLGWLKGRRIKW